MKSDLILRTVGALTLLVCPRRVFGDNVFVLNQGAAEVFRCWSREMTAAKVVEELKQSFSLPPEFPQHVSNCLKAFDSLDCGEAAPLFETPLGNVSDLGADKTFWDDRVPVYGGIEPTWRCNLNCCHCYIRDPHKAELTLDEWKAILDQLAEAGCLHLAIGASRSQSIEKKEGQLL
jgi:hypothetical protein